MSASRRQNANEEKWSRSDSISLLALIFSVAIPGYLEFQRTSEAVASLQFISKIQNDGTLHIWQQSGDFYAPESYSLQPSYWSDGKLIDGEINNITLSTYSISKPSASKSEYKIANVAELVCKTEPQPKVCIKGKSSIAIKFKVKGDDRVDFASF